MPISTVQQPTQPGRAAAPLPRPTAIGMISTYPPTQCGLATFSAALIEHMQLSHGVARRGAAWSTSPSRDPARRWWRSW